MKKIKGKVIVAIMIIAIIAVIMVGYQQFVPEVHKGINVQGILKVKYLDGTEKTFIAEQPDVMYWIKYQGEPIYWLSWTPNILVSPDWSTAQIANVGLEISTFMYYDNGGTGESHTVYQIKENTWQSPDLVAIVYTNMSSIYGPALMELEPGEHGISVKFDITASMDAPDGSVVTNTSSVIYGLTITRDAYGLTVQIKEQKAVCGDGYCDPVLENIANCPKYILGIPVGGDCE